MKKVAALFISIGLLTGTDQSMTYARPGTTEPIADRCGHAAEQRRKMRRKLRGIGASQRQVRKVMRRCRRRKGIPYHRGWPGDHATPAHAASLEHATTLERAFGRSHTVAPSDATAQRCASEIITRYSWAAPTPMDLINPFTYRLMDLEWRLSYCYRRKRKVIRSVHWDVSGEPTQLGSLLGWSFEGVIDRAGWYSTPTPDLPCTVNGKKRPKACYETWVRSRTDICILSHGCVGQKLPYVRVYLYCACSQGFGVLVTTIRNDPG
jgi:hypothetical protein